MHTRIVYIACCYDGEWDTGIEIVGVPGVMVSVMSVNCEINKLSKF